MLRTVISFFSLGLLAVAIQAQGSTCLLGAETSISAVICESQNQRIQFGSYMTYPSRTDHCTISPMGAGWFIKEIKFYDSEIKPFGIHQLGGTGGALGLFPASTQTFDPTATALLISKQINAALVGENPERAAMLAKILFNVIEKKYPLKERIRYPLPQH